MRNKWDEKKLRFCENTFIICIVDHSIEEGGIIIEKVNEDFSLYSHI